jgi:cytochrome c-type biogenesis protein CcsB
MNIFQMENFFANYSFFFLFLSMISYWVQIAFNIQKWNIGRITMFIANFCLLSLLILRWKESGHFPLSNLYESLMFLSWSLSTFHLLLENIESGVQSNPPGQSSGGAIEFSASNLGTRNTIFDFFKNQKEQKKISIEKLSLSTFPNEGSGSPQVSRKEKRFFVGAFTSPTALFINAFATFRLPLEMQHSSPLVPALQSNWLMMHVTVMILSYSALICGSLLSIAFLIVTKNLQFDVKSEKKSSETTQSSLPTEILSKNSAPIHPAGQSPGRKAVYPPGLCPGGKAESFALTEQQTVSSFSFQNGEFFSDQKFAFSSDLQMEANTMVNTLKNQNTSQMQMKKKFAENLDNLSYRILGIGFPLLTIGILSGAVWANEAWGSYWSWDPKETWALATWLVFAIYLHLRISKGWHGKKPAILASLGFVTVWICFLGVNLLGEGLHSYGFLKDSF